MSSRDKRVKLDDDSHQIKFVEKTMTTLYFEVHELCLIVDSRRRCGRIDFNWVCGANVWNFWIRQREVLNKNYDFQPVCIISCNELHGTQKGAVELILVANDWYGRKKCNSLRGFEVHNNLRKYQTLPSTCRIINGSIQQHRAKSKMKCYTTRTI